MCGHPSRYIDAILGIASSPATLLCNELAALWACQAATMLLACLAKGCAQDDAIPKNVLACNVTAAADIGFACCQFLLFQ